MKKSFKLFVFAILAGLAFSTTSCKKCQTCDLVLDNGTISLSTEICGDKDAQAQSEADCESTAAADTTGTLSCNCSTAFSFTN